MFLARGCAYHIQSSTRSSLSLLRLVKPAALVQRVMASTENSGKFGGHAKAGSKYGSDGVTDYAARPSRCVVANMYIDPVIDAFLKSEVPGKKVLDIGCGLGNWSLKAAQFGAKSVDGFDYEEEMVKVAKKTTSQCDNVRICVGDAGNMSYGDNEFDVAISLAVANNLTPETFIKHFEELYRVLIPGGKSMVMFPVDAAYHLHTQGADPATVRTKLDSTLGSLPNHPTADLIRETLKSFDEVLIGFITSDKNGKYSVVMDQSELQDGQKVWVLAETIVAPNFYYSRSYYDKYISAAGLHLEKSEHGFTEEWRVAYNRDKKPEEQSHYIFAEPLVTHFRLTKPQ